VRNYSGVSGVIRIIIEITRVTYESDKLDKFFDLW